jgi:hypothetical protein
MSRAHLATEMQAVIKTGTAGLQRRPHLYGIYDISCGKVLQDGVLALVDMKAPRCIELLQGSLGVGFRHQL